MFEITFENDVHVQWSCEYIFETIDDAKEYLIKKGFVEQNRLYYSKHNQWLYDLKAYIEPKKVYQTSHQ